MVLSLLLPFTSLLLLVGASGPPCENLGLGTQATLDIAKYCPQFSISYQLVSGYAFGNNSFSWLLTCRANDHEHTPQLLLPTNEAWEAYFLNHGSSLSALLDPDRRTELQRLLRRHVTCSPHVEAGHAAVGVGAVLVQVTDRVLEEEIETVAAAGTTAAVTAAVEQEEGGELRPGGAAGMAEGDVTRRMAQAGGWPPMRISISWTERVSVTMVVQGPDLAAPRFIKDVTSGPYVESQNNTESVVWEQQPLSGRYHVCAAVYPIGSSYIPIMYSQAASITMTVVAPRNADPAGRNVVLPVKTVGPGGASWYCDPSSAGYVGSVDWCTDQGCSPTCTHPRNGTSRICAPDQLCRAADGACVAPCGGEVCAPGRSCVGAAGSASAGSVPGCVTDGSFRLTLQTQMPRYVSRQAASVGAYVDLQVQTPGLALLSSSSRADRKGVFETANSRHLAPQSVYWKSSPAAGRYHVCANFRKAQGYWSGGGIAEMEMGIVLSATSSLAALGRGNTDPAGRNRTFPATALTKVQDEFTTLPYTSACYPGRAGYLGYVDWCTGKTCGVPCGGRSCAPGLVCRPEDQRCVEPCGRAICRASQTCVRATPLNTPACVTKGSLRFTLTWDTPGANTSILLRLPAGSQTPNGGDSGFITDKRLGKYDPVSVFWPSGSPPAGRYEVCAIVEPPDRSSTDWSGYTPRYYPTTFASEFLEKRHLDAAVQVYGISNGNPAGQDVALQASSVPVMADVEDIPDLYFHDAYLRANCFEGHPGHVGSYDWCLNANCTTPCGAKKCRAPQVCRQSDAVCVEPCGGQICRPDQRCIASGLPYNTSACITDGALRFTIEWDSPGVDVRLVVQTPTGNIRGLLIDATQTGGGLASTFWPAGSAAPIGHYHVCATITPVLDSYDSVRGVSPMVVLSAHGRLAPTAPPRSWTFSAKELGPMPGVGQLTRDAQTFYSSRCDPSHYGYLATLEWCNADNDCSVSCGRQNRCQAPLVCRKADGACVELCGRAVCAPSRSCVSAPPYMLPTCVPNALLRFTLTWSILGAKATLVVKTPRGGVISAAARAADGGLYDKESGNTGGLAAQSVFWSSAPPAGTYLICASVTSAGFTTTSSSSTLPVQLVSASTRNNMFPAHPSTASWATAAEIPTAAETGPTSMLDCTTQSAGFVAAVEVMP